MSESFIHVGPLDTTLGAILIGSIVSMFFFGIVTLQAHQYFTSFPDDRWRMKALVGAVWILELAHTTVVGYTTYHTTITLYGEPQRVARLAELGIIIIIGGLITLCTQSFFALRLYTILPKPYYCIGALCIFFSAARYAGSLFLAYQVITTASVTLYQTQWKWLITTLLTGGAALDLFIAVSTFSYLLKKRKTVFQRSRRLIDYLIAYSIRTGLLTSVTAAVMLICFQLMPSNFVWVGIYIFLGKLYSNSLYSALNSRKKLRISMQESPCSEEVASSRRISVMRNSGRSEQVSEQNLNVCPHL